MSNRFTSRFKMKGGALIEFALVLPIMTLLLVGVIETSVLLYDKAIITNASREGARYGVMLKNPYYTMTAVQSYTSTYLSGKLLTFGAATSATVTATPSATPQKTGDLLTVTITYPYSYLVLHNFIGL
jgi:Flp pilus assembly protein TadG